MANHGGLIEAELGALGIAPGDVLDLSVNVNPYGPCPAVRAAIAAAPLEHYPDPTAQPARRALAAWMKVAEARVVVGNGAVDLLWTLARAWLREGDGALIVEPTFSEMRAAAMRVGARIDVHPMDATNDFALDLGALDAAIGRVRPRLVYVCAPSNPTGRATPLRALADLAERWPATLFVVDISFLSLSTHHADEAWRGSERVFWLRSLTKDHALAGLRIGCAVAPPELAQTIEAERPPWSVNAFAQAAAIAIATPEGDRFVARSRAKILEDRLALEVALRPMKLSLCPSDTIFLLADLGEATATDLRAKLLRDHRILVRDCTSFGLPHHIRIAARPAPDRDRFVSALREVLRS